MLAALLTNLPTETPDAKSGVRRLRQQDEQLPRDFREQDPDFIPRPPQLRGDFPVTGDADKPTVIKTPSGEVVPVEPEPEKSSVTPDLQAMMSKAREVGLADEMARAILEDDEEAILVILMAADL